MFSLTKNSQKIKLKELFWFSFFFFFFEKRLKILTTNVKKKQKSVYMKSEQISRKAPADRRPKLRAGISITTVMAGEAETNEIGKR